MHSSRMRTARSSSRLLGGGGSASVHVGIPPGVGLETPLVWAWRPPCVGLETPLGVAWRPSGCGPGDPPDHTPQPPSLGYGPREGQTPQLPPWECGPGDLQGMLGYHPWRLARHAGIPPAVYAGIPPPPCEQNDRQLQKFYLAPNFVCGLINYRQEKIILSKNHIGNV